jgi:cold shock CspA family protein
VLGKMLWFNSEKGHGLIRTEEDERLRVDESGFSPGEVPEGRCVGMDVSFERELAGGEPRAVNVTFVTATVGLRARRRRKG